MRQSAIASAWLASILACVWTGAVMAAPVSVSGPVTHDNLAIYFIHGRSQPGPVPLTLEEALAAGTVQVRETSNVNALAIENTGDKPVFIQAGDIVKGGKQDRTLTVSLLLPPKSGRVPIASFCVEHGRWSKRAREDASKFTTASSVVPSREMKLAMLAPVATTGSAPSPMAETSLRQRKVWDGVRVAQQRLSRSTGADVRAAASQSSLQLSLENEKLAAARAAYVKALKDTARDDDIVGFVFTVNGKLNSGDTYMSNALFRKMWPKLLAASATEAIGRLNETGSDGPSAEDVGAFLAALKEGETKERPLDFGMRRVLHEADRGYLVEAVYHDDFVHRSYLAR